MGDERKRHSAEARARRALAKVVKVNAILSDPTATAAKSLEAAMRVLDWTHTEQEALRRGLDVSAVDVILGPGAPI